MPSRRPKVLKAKGEFKSGIFTWIDENGQKHNMDGIAVCFEEATGKKLASTNPATMTSW